MLNINLVKTVSNYVNNKNLHKMLLAIPQYWIVNDSLYVKILGTKRYYFQSISKLIEKNDLSGLKWKYNYERTKMTRLEYNILCEMAAQNKLKLLQWYINNINSIENRYVFMMIYWSIYYGQLRILKWMFKKFKITGTGSIDNFVLLAIKRDHFSILEFLMKTENFKNIDKKNIDKKKILNGLIRSKNLKIVEYCDKYLNYSYDDFKKSHFWYNFPISMTEIIKNMMSVDVLKYFHNKIPQLFDNLKFNRDSFEEDHKQDILLYIFKHNLSEIVIGPLYDNDMNTICSRLSITDHVLIPRVINTGGNPFAGPSGQTSNIPMHSFAAAYAEEASSNNRFN